MHAKPCRECGELFWANSSTPYCNRCRPIVRRRQKAAQQARYRQKNPEKAKEFCRRYYARTMKGNPAKLAERAAAVRAARARKKAAAAGIPVCKSCGTIGTIEDIRAQHPTALSCCPERDTGPVA